MGRIRAATAAVIQDDPAHAGREAADEVLDALGRTPDLLLAFASSDRSTEAVVAGLHARLPAGVSVVGCSSDTEVDTRGALRHSIAVMGLLLDGIEVRPFHVEPHGADNIAMGRAAGAALTGMAPDLVIAFPDVLHANGTQFLLGLQGVIGKNVPVIGGAPSELAAFKNTYTICGRTVRRGGASGVALRGPLQVATAAHSGYLPVGLARTVTGVEDGKVLLSLDGRPALDVYREYLGARASEMPGVSIEFPLAVVGGALGTQRQAGDAFSIVRAVFGVDEARGALIFGGDIPQGALVRVTRAASADVLRGAEEAARAARAHMPDPDLALIFSCNSRRIVLGPRFREECRAAFAHLPEGLPKIGFYTFGEISPVDGVSMHHESTFTIGLLRGLG
jgi:hypothetical protein